jgi:hypothetical protein
MSITNRQSTFLSQRLKSAGTKTSCSQPVTFDLRPAELETVDIVGEFQRQLPWRLADICSVKIYLDCPPPPVIQDCRTMAKERRGTCILMFFIHLLVALTDYQL